MRPAPLLLLLPLLAAGCALPGLGATVASDCARGDKPDLLAWTHAQGGPAMPENATATSTQGRVDRDGHLTLDTYASDAHGTRLVGTTTRALTSPERDALCAAALDLVPRAPHDEAGADCDALHVEASTARGDSASDIACPATAAGQALHDLLLRVATSQG